MWWLVIILIILIAINDFFIIESYKNIIFKNYWHYSKFLITTLIGILLFGFTKNLIVFYFLYFVFFEIILNILRKKRPFYVSLEKGSKSDEFRVWLFGAKHVEKWEFALKFLVLITAISILIQ